MKRRDRSIAQDVFDVTRDLLAEPRAGGGLGNKGERFTSPELHERMPWYSSSQISAALHDLADRGCGVRLVGHRGRTGLWRAFPCEAPKRWNAGYQGVTRNRKPGYGKAYTGSNRAARASRSEAKRRAIQRADPSGLAEAVATTSFEAELRDVSERLLGLAEAVERLANASHALKRQAS